MSFSLSGSVITQSGTDTSLAGLTGIAGVTSRTLTNGIVIYNTANLQLVITGSLTWSQEAQILEMGTGVLFPNVDVASGGALVIGATTTGGTYTRTRFGVALICSTVSPTTFQASEASIRLSSGGSLALNGAIVYHYGTLNFSTSGTFTSNGGNFISPNDRHRWFDGAIAGTGLTCTGGVFNTNSSQTILNFSPQLISTTYTSLANRPVYRNYISGQNTALDFRADAGGLFIARNLIKGSQFTYAPFTTPSANSANNYGGIVSIKELTFDVGASILDCSVLIPYTDNGNRRDGLGFTFTTLNFENARTNSSGVVNMDLYTAAVIRATGGLAGTPLVGENRVDYRGKTGIAGEDLFDAYFCHYNYQLQSVANFVAKGADRLTVKTQLFTDSSVVEPSKAVAAAYTGYAINTFTDTITLTDADLEGARVYDFVKAWKDTNHSLQYPSISTLLCVKDGTTLDFGSINLVIDGVTWKSHATVTTIKTTGTITFKGGADYEVTVIDSTGTRYPAITISGFPTANNSNGIAPAPKVSLTNLRTDATQAYTVSGSTINLKLSAVGALPDDDVKITTDAVGYIRPLDQTVKGNRTEPVAFIFSPWLNSKGQEIVGLESAAAIDFDLIEEQLLLPTGVISFYAALMQWEAVTAGGSFYLFPTDAVRRFNFIEGFDGSKRVVVADPWTIASKPDDVSSPIINDFVVLSQTVSRDPFEHGLESTASGLTDRPEVVIAFQNPGTSVTVTSIAANAITAASVAADAVAEIQSGLATSSQVGGIPTNPLLTSDSRLNNLDAAITSRSNHTPSDVWTVTTRAITDKSGFALSSTAEDELVTKVWSATTRSLTSFGTLIADIWDATARTLTTAFPSIPTANANAAAVRTELSTELSRIDASINSRLAASNYTTPPDTAAITTAVWNAATRTLTAVDKTGYSLTSTERTAIATAVEAALINEGDGQQLIDAILQVINSNLDLPTLELTAIAQAVRTNLATELGRIDDNISSRLADADYTAPTVAPTTAAIASAVDALLADNFAAIPTAPTASQNAAAVRTELATELSRIDAPINSRSTPAQVTAAQTAVQGSISALNNLSQSQVQSAAADALTVYDPPTKAELDSALAALPTTSQIDAILLDNFAAIIDAMPSEPDNTAIASIKNKVDQLTISSGKVSATLNGDPVVLPSDAVAKLTELWGLRGLDATHPAVIEPLEQTYNGVTLTLVQSGSGQNASVTITRS
jgi:hypothetical protein